MTSKYLSKEYAATDFDYPYVQPLRGEDPKQCGYFVPLSQANKAGWRDLDPSNLTEYAYNSGETEVGILLQKPRMVLTPICQLGQFDRKASQDEGNLVVIGAWDRKYKGENVGNFQVYLVMFFDDQKQPLHDIPLKLVAKGSHQASLSQEWQKFCTSVACCQARANQTMFSPRNEAFNALCLFQPHIIRKSVGDKIKSAACYVDGFVPPKVDNWQEFFLGTDEEIADVVIAMLNPRPRLMLADPTPGAMVLGASEAPQSTNPQIAPVVENAVAPGASAIDVNFSAVDEELENIPF
jgi:hypothetical protein